MKKRIGLLQKLDDLIRKARAPVYLHRFGPKTYTTRQHLKVWLLKEKFKQSWRDFIDDIAPDYFDNVPDRSTLIKFVKRLPFWLKNKLIAESAGADPAEYGSIDSTGLSRSNASRHYVKRIQQENPVKEPLKLSMYVSGQRIFSIRLRTRWCGDTRDVPYLLDNAPILALINCLDKGYDAEYIHEEFRKRGVYSIIPVRKRCKKGKYRKQMRDCFDHAQYWERNASEYNNSSLKRRFGDYVRSVNFRAQHSEVSARVILHNLISILHRLFHHSRKLEEYNASF